MRVPASDAVQQIQDKGRYPLYLSRFILQLFLLCCLSCHIKHSVWSGNKKKMTERQARCHWTMVQFQFQIFFWLFTGSYAFFAKTKKKRKNESLKRLPETEFPRSAAKDSSHLTPPFVGLLCNVVSCMWRQCGGNPKAWTTTTIDCCSDLRVDFQP